MDQFNIILPTALEWHVSGIGAAVATVIRTWGSAPRPVGSQLAVSGEGDIVGSVSGGCVEGAVIIEALNTLKTGRNVILEYGVSDEDAFAVGLACGGNIQILVEPVGFGLSETIVAELVCRCQRKEPVAYSIDIKSGVNKVITLDIADGKKNVVTHTSGFYGAEFLVIYEKPLRMAVIGGVHIAQPLVSIARMSGFAVMVIDPRSTFLNAIRFPNVELSNLWPDDALKAFKPDSRTAIITLSHDPKIDDLGLIEALYSNCFYIGCLGSKKTHSKRFDRLSKIVNSDVCLSRLHGPIGLNIQSRTPTEIAISIMAEVIQSLRVN
ncbi:MAG: XdhC family protein [Rhodobacteraceae bacterium]|nr:XdhC family protein [Paracoccaceae bacterium]